MWEGPSWKINNPADWKVSCAHCSPRWIDLEGGHHEVGLLVDQLGHEAVPGAVHYPAPLAVLHPLQSKIKTEIIWEFLDQVNTESWAASEFGRVGISHLLGDVYTNWEEQPQNMHKNNSSNNKSFQRLHKYPVFGRLNIGFFSVCAVCGAVPSSESATIWQRLPLVAVHAVGWSSMMYGSSCLSIFISRY